MTVYGLSLCSGIGGLDLGLHLALPGYRTVCYVEVEPYPQDILLARMADGVLDRAPIWGDIKQFDARSWRGLVDIVHGGYPCQPFSFAGKRGGAEDPRHLWPDVARVVRECEPEWCFFENVAGHLTLGFDVVAQDLEEMGYRVTAGLFTAAEVGAPHRRQRLYILAHRDGRRPQGEWGSRVLDGERSSQWHDIDGRGSADSAVGHADDSRLEGRRKPEREGADEWPAWPPGPEERDRWADVLARRPDLAPAVADTQRRGRSDRLSQRLEAGHVETNSSRGGGRAEANSSLSPAQETNERTPTQPAIRRVADGVPHRVDRLKTIGNAVVPAVAALAWRTLIRQL